MKKCQMKFSVDIVDLVSNRMLVFTFQDKSGLLTVYYGRARNIMLSNYIASRMNAILTTNDSDSQAELALLQNGSAQQVEQGYLALSTEQRFCSLMQSSTCLQPRQAG
jgi:hypothetical protein